MKYFKLVECYHIFKCQSPLHKRKAPYWRLAGDGSGFSICHCVFFEKKSATKRKNKNVV